MGSRPNFIFILADDLGYADLGCYGCRRPSTPVLDGLAHTGLRFSDAYANSSLCSPTRFALITGRYQYRYRGSHDEPIGGHGRGSRVLGLSPHEPSLPSRLKRGGYATALVGKWHLGYPPHFGPRASGYDEFFGSVGGAVDYFQHTDMAGIHDLYDNETEVFVDGYYTDLVADRAAEYVNRASRRGGHFMLSVHFTAPHWPWQRREDRERPVPARDSLSHVTGGSVGLYYDMVRQMDEGIGRILQAVRDSGIEQDTLIVFTSDNGGERYSDVWPFVGKKMDLLEGGIRVPLVISWPGTVAGGRVTGQVAMSMDWLPTMLAAADLDAEATGGELDGCSLLEVLRQPDREFERDAFWRMKHRDQQAYRRGPWKYLSMDGNEYLFNLAEDARERANKAPIEPQRLQSMRHEFQIWSATMPPIAPDAWVGFPHKAELMARPS
jgi:arylsulfatase A-like enzyme